MEKIPTWHNAASKWQEQNGFIDEAIEHALRAEDYLRAASLIENQADVVWASGEHTKMWRWLDILPPEVVTSRPELMILRAVNFFTRGQPEVAKQFLHSAEQALTPSKDLRTEKSTITRDQLPEVKKRALLGRISAMRALIASYQGDAQSIIPHAREALELIPATDISWRCTAAISQADAQSYLGEMAAAYQAHLQAIEICKKTGNTYLFLYSHTNLAITLKQQGRLKQALKICQKQMQLAIEKEMDQTGVAGWLLSVWGEGLAEVNKLDEAFEHAKRGVEQTEQAGDMMMLGWSYPSMVRVLFSLGDLSGAKKILQKMEDLERGSQAPPWISKTKKAWQVRIWLEQNKIEDVSQWAQESGLEVDGDINYLQEMEYIVLARTLIAQESLSEASELLLRLLDVAEKGGRTTRLIEIMILQAYVLQAGGKLDQSIAALERALRMAEPGGYIRIFVDEGPPMARLLYEANNRGVMPDYVQRLLTAFTIAEAEQVTSTKPEVDQSVLIEPLSEREIEVLQLIAEGLTNQEIAARLYLSPNTVKVHTRNINSKLGAHNRAQAVARARALGILPSI